MTAFPLIPARPPFPTAPRIEAPAVAVVPDTGQLLSLAVAGVPGVRMDAGVKVLLVEDVSRVAAHIADLLRGHEHIRLVGTVTDGREAMTRIHETGPDVILLDALMQGPASGLQVAKAVRTSGLATPIVFMTVPDHPITLSPETGHAAALVLPLDQAALIGAIERLDDAHRGPAPVTPSGLFVVFSAKGGVGRTVIAHHLAGTLQRRGARVALVDGDMVHGDLRLHLDAPANAPSLLQFPTGHATPDDMSAVLWQDPTGIDVLLAPPRMEQADLIVKRDIENALTMLRCCYDVVVVDAPARMDDMTLSMLDRADAVVDVVTAEPGSLRKTQRCRQVMAAAHFDMDKVMTVVNRAVASGGDSSRVAAALGIVPAFELPEDPALARGDVMSRPASASSDVQGIAAGLGALADALVSHTQRGSRLTARAV